MPTLPSSNQNYFDTAIFNASIPKEGPKALGVVAPFGSGSGRAASFDINLLLTQSQGYMSIVQAVFVDNSLNSDEVAIGVSVIGQSLKVPANAQAYLPLLVPKNATITVASAGDANVGFVFVNVPLPACVWGGLS